MRRNADGTLRAEPAPGLAHAQRDGRPRRARAAVLDPARLRRLLRKAGFSAASSAPRSSSSAWARTPSSRCSSATATGALLGQNGNSYSDTGYQSTWEVSRAQPGTSGRARRLHRRADRRRASAAARRRAARSSSWRRSSRVMPGITAKWNGRATLDYWTGLPWTKGSYSYWKVGQYQAFAGVERRALGQLPLRRRAHVDRLPGLPQRRGRERRARGRRDTRRPLDLLDSADLRCREPDQRVHGWLPRYSPLDGPLD